MPIRTAHARIQVVDTRRRTYDNACAAAHALDVVGDRWAILVVRELVLGPKRFTDLRSGLPGIGPDMLAARLRDLESAGVVGTRELAPPASSAAYELRLDDQTFAVRIGAGALAAERGEPEVPAASIATDPGTLAGLLWQGL